MEILTLLLCVALTVQSVIKGAPCARSEPQHEASTHQQQELPQVRQADEPS